MLKLIITKLKFVRIFGVNKAFGNEIYNQFINKLNENNIKHIFWIIKYKIVFFFSPTAIILDVANNSVII